VEFGSVGNHLAHGDFLGTCEFLNSGGLSRATALRERLQKNKNVSENPLGIGNKLTMLNGPQTQDPSQTIGARGRLSGKSPLQVGAKRTAPGVPTTTMRSTTVPTSKVPAPKAPRD
jgi:hypothetical protein